MELARHEADMDLLEFMEVEASDKPTSATPAGPGPGRPRKRRRELPSPNANDRKLATTTTIIIAHDTHDTRGTTTTSTSTSATLEELECVAHAAEAAVVAADGPPRLVDYPDSEGADEADLDGGDSEATELPDETEREDEGDEEDKGKGDDGGGSKERDARTEDGDEDSEMTQSMDMEEMLASVIPDVATSQREEEDDTKGKEERNTEERKNERDERAGDELGRESAAADKQEQGEGGGAGTGGEQERRVVKGDKAKRRLPDWMVLTPKQLQQAQAEKEREMRESKAVLREQALRFFEIMQCSSTPPEPSDSTVDNGESAEQVAAGAGQDLPVASPLHSKPLVAVAPVMLESEVLVSDTVRYTDVLLPIEEGRVVIFDLETSGFGADASIIEIGAVELVDGQRTGIVFQSYAKAMGSINPYAFKAHGLSEEFLSYHQSIEIVLTNFMRWVGQSPLVAHNSRFDLRMLCQELRRWDIPMHGNMVFCTLRYYRAKYPGMAYSLDDLASHFRIDQIIERRTHGALVDAEICARVYQKFLDAL